MVTFNTYDIVKLCTVKMSLRCLRGNDLGSPLEDLIGILNLHLKLRFRYTFEVVTPVLLFVDSSLKGAPLHGVIVVVVVITG